MSEMATADLLADSVARALADVVTARGTVEAEAQGIDAAAWKALRDLGLVGEEAAAMPLGDQAAVIEAIGHAAALVPYVDSEALARWVAHGAGFATDDGEGLALLVASPGDLAGKAVAWGRHATRTVVAFEDGGQALVSLVRTERLQLGPMANLAGEPSDRCGVATLAIEERREVPASLSPAAIRRRGALYRCAAMLGAAGRIQALTLQYATDRKQFGKPLSQFQVIQAYLAQMAGELSAVRAMLATALVAEEAGEATLECAAAKVRFGQAVPIIAGLAHQVHGAIGFTQEYALQLWTRRLWAWREEYGNESEWARALGSAAIALGPEATWERITR